MAFPYQRMLIVGCGGSGKSTLSRTLGERTGLPVVHLDKIWWLPGWEHITCEQFDEKLAVELAKPAWIIEGNYARTFAVRLTRADFCVFLDLDTKTCMESALARNEMYKGRSRPDITEGCEERMDPEFEQWILDFKEKVCPRMLKELRESGVPHRIFTSREEAWAWMDALTAQ